VGHGSPPTAPRGQQPLGDAGRLPAHIPASLPCQPRDLRLHPKVARFFDRQAVDQAIADGIIDVINFSISGGVSPWKDSNSLSFLAAEEAGIFVAAAAGNTGTSVPVPVPRSTNHREP
jgi:hypothetical protein